MKRKRRKLKLRYCLICHKGRDATRCEKCGRRTEPHPDIKRFPRLAKRVRKLTVADPFETPSMRTAKRLEGNSLRRTFQGGAVELGQRS